MSSDVSDILGIQNSQDQKTELGTILNSNSILLQQPPTVPQPPATSPKSGTLRPSKTGRRTRVHREITALKDLSQVFTSSSAITRKSRTSIQAAGSPKPLFISADQISLFPRAPKFKKKRKLTNETAKWLYRPFRNTARTDDATFRHWEKLSEPQNEYPWARFNKEIETLHYTDEEYTRLVEPTPQNPLNPGWDREKTDALFHLVKTFDMRFIVVCDRFNELFRPQSKPRSGDGDCDQPQLKPRSSDSDGFYSVEQIKDRYYSILRLLLIDRAQHTSAEQEQLATNPIIQIPYNLKEDQERVHFLKQSYSKTHEKRIEEYKHYNRAKQFELLNEKNRLLAKNTLNHVYDILSNPPLSSRVSVCGDDTSFAGAELSPPLKKTKAKNKRQRQQLGACDDDDDDEMCRKTSWKSGDEKNSPLVGQRLLEKNIQKKVSGVLTRSSFFKFPFSHGRITNDKISLALQQLGLKYRMLPTEKVVKFFNELRSDIAILFECQKVVQHAEIELETLELQRKKLKEMVNNKNNRDVKVKIKLEKTPDPIIHHQDQDTNETTKQSPPTEINSKSIPTQMEM